MATLVTLLIESDDTNKRLDEFDFPSEPDTDYGVS